jgi:hypothetical protein
VNNDERYKQGLKRMGQGYSKANRLNPNNPLSYLALMHGNMLGKRYKLEKRPDPI